MDRLINLPKQNETTCVGGVCGEAALNMTGLSQAQDNTSSVVTAVITNLLIGSACMLGFLVFRTFMKQYQLRTILPQITVRPPVLARDTFIHKVFGWLVPVFAKSDAYILRAAGLDALVLQKVHAVGLQICTPLAFIGCCFILPLQIREGYITGASSYARLTAANITPGSHVMWAHCAMLFVMLAWVFALLEYHTREYAAVRQHYLKGSDDANEWRDLHMAEADGTMVHKQAKLLALVGEAKHEQDLELLLQELDETVRKRTWWRRAMISLTSWTGQESAESAAMQGNALIHTKSRARSSRSLKVEEGREPASPSGRLHIDLASDVIQGDFVRDAKSATPSGGGNSPTTPASPAPGLAGAASGDGSPAAAAGAGGGSSLKSLATMAKGGPDVPLEAPPAECDIKAEEINNLVAHKWWSQIEHVAARDGKLRRLTQEEEVVKEVQQVMLAKPSVRFRKTINAIDHSGRRMAVHAQQYAVLVTNVSHPCYPEYCMLPKQQTPGAGMCGNLDHTAIPKGVKYDLEGPLQGHAEVGAPLHKRLSSSRSFDPTRSGKLEDFGDVETGVASGKQPREDRSHLPHPHVKMTPKTHRDITTSANLAQKQPGVKEGVSSASSGSEPAGPNNSVVRHRSGKELWALVRQFAKDKKTSGRSLYLLSRDKEYSIVGHVFSQLFPEDYDRVVPVFNFRRVDLLMRQWDVRLGQLENAEWSLKRTGKRPQRKLKFCGLAGRQVDTIDWLNDEINRLEDSILMERDAALVYGQTPSWFVLFRSQKAAAIAASCNILPMNQDLFQVQPAPGPEEVNWESLWFNHAQRRLRQFVTTPFAILVVFAPVSLLTSAISSLNQQFCQAVNWDFYCTSTTPFSNILRGLITGFLPSLLIILWQGLCLPRLVYLVAQSEGRHLSLSAVDRRMGELYFFWDIFNMFAQGVLGAAAVNAATGSAVALQKSGELFSAPQEVPRIIGEALPASSKFFFTYIIMRTFMSVPLRFLITQPGVWQSWLRLCDFFSKDENVPPRTRFMRYAIRSPRYGVEYGSMLLILLISLTFALISPLIVIFGAVFCGGMWVYWRYQLMYNYQRKYESGGLMWHFFVNRVLVCCAVMAAFTGCVLIIKQGFVQAALIWLFGIVSTISFAGHLNRKYMNAIVEQPLYLANNAPRARVPSSIYVPPPLQANGLGWYPEFNKCWEWFGMPGYSY